MKSDVKVKRLALAGMMAALSFAGYALFPAINAFGLKFHLGNAFVVLGALLLGGPAGGLAGAIGLSLADILGGWASTAPITFVCKLVIGLVSGLVAHHIAKISRPHPKGYLVKWTLLSSLAGLGLNCLVDPVLNYLWQCLIMPGAEAFLSINVIFTCLNAVVNTVFTIVLYLVLRPAVQKLGIL